MTVSIELSENDFQLNFHIWHKRKCVYLQVRTHEGGLIYFWPVSVHSLLLTYSGYLLAIPNRHKPVLGIGLRRVFNFTFQPHLSRRRVSEPLLTTRRGVERFYRKMPLAACVTFALTLWRLQAAALQWHMYVYVPVWPWTWTILSHSGAPVSVVFCFLLLKIPKCSAYSPRISTQLASSVSVFTLFRLLLVYFCDS